MEPVVAVAGARRSAVAGRIMIATITITITEPRPSSAHSSHILKADITIDCAPTRIEGRFTYLRSTSDPKVVTPMWGDSAASSDILRWALTLTDESESQVFDAIARGAGTYEIDVCEAGEGGVRR